MVEPRRDNSGILFPERLRRLTQFRRYAAAPPLTRLVEHYWLNDWNLGEPLAQSVVPHPSVNIVWQSPNDAHVRGVTGGLSRVRLEGVGRVFGVQFRPGGFAAFVGGGVGEFNDRQVPLTEVFGPAAEQVTRFVLTSRDDAARVAAVDEFLLSQDPVVDPELARTIELARVLRGDRGIRHVAELARRADVSTRWLQRKFGAYIGPHPKWLIRRYRVHEAIEIADSDIDWARLALRLGYSDQAHLVRDFSGITGVSPTRYARARRSGQGA